MTLMIVNFFDDDFHVINETTLMIAEVGPCTVTLNALIFDLVHVCSIKLFKLFVITPWFSISL